MFNIPSWVSFGHFYASFRKCLSGMLYIFGKNISKFVFENSWFQKADAFQSLCGGHSVAVLNDGQRLWYRIYFFEINRKRATGNYVMFILLHGYCHRGFGCGEMITIKFSTFSVTLTHATGPSDFVNAMQVHRSLWVITTVHKFWDPFRSPPPWSPNDMIVTDICQYIMCLI